MKNINQQDRFRLVEKLEKSRKLSKTEWICLIDGQNEELSKYIFDRAVALRKSLYGNDVYIRGLIEFTNYCKNDCYYCGIRCSNNSCQRYRLSFDEILSCCKSGYELGYRTFVLQGGEDPFFSDTMIADIVSSIKNTFPECAVTLSLGEHSRESYLLWKKAGAERYLLRHETANEEHYKRLHPKKMSFSNRIRCLYDLKELDYQVGCGFMVGSPYQTSNTLADDMLFLEKLQPDMVGIGPFIPHKDTPFNTMHQGTLAQTLYMLGLIRLLLPDVLLPATTALGTIHPFGRELGIQAGANVCMPNLSPVNVRKKYELYDNKICTGDEAAECRGCLEGRMKKIGYKIVVSKGDRIGRSLSL